MLRWLTAGESHGPALVGIIEGVPAGVELTSAQIADSLARRRLGYGRGARMKFEQDVVTILGGVRHGLTQGGPVAIQVGNTEWPKWETDHVLRSRGPGDPGRPGPQRPADPPPARPRRLHRHAEVRLRRGPPRPGARQRPRDGHPGGRSAPSPRAFLKQLGIELVSHTVSIASVAVPEGRPLPVPANVLALDADPLRCFDRETSDAMVAEVDVAHKEGETLGGVVEVLAYGLPPGLGSYVHWDRRLDSRLAAALMGIQAIKGVEVGDGFLTASRRGSAAHDEIVKDADGKIIRTSNRAGGIEGGMSIGDVLRVRAAMKPIATVPRALKTVDVSTGEAAKAHHQRSDVCAVPAAGVVAEAMVALVLAEAVTEKFGGDSVQETARNIKGYLDNIPASLDSIGH